MGHRHGQWQARKSATTSQIKYALCVGSLDEWNKRQAVEHMAIPCDVTFTDSREIHDGIGFKQQVEESSQSIKLSFLKLYLQLAQALKECRWYFRHVRTFLGH